MFSASILVVVLSYTWLIAPVTPPWMAAIPVALILGLTAARAIRTGEWGLKGAALLPAFAWSAALTAAVTLVIYAAGTRLGTWHDLGDPWARLLFLVPWGFGQQFALQTVFLRDAQALTSRRGGFFLAALMFAALHLPNPFLTLATGVAAMFWCWIYDRHPNLLPLALSHAVLTLAVLYAFDDAITGRLRVGAGY